MSTPVSVPVSLPPAWVVPSYAVAAELATAPRLVVLDDDPTGTQTVADLPVLTSWSVADLRWALRQPTPAFFVLTNTRSLSPEAAADRDREVIRALHEAAEAEGVAFVPASRSDSTLRGHFPLETDVLAQELAALGTGAPDGVLLVPAYIEAGRVTIDSRHWIRTPEGLLPVGESEFARDTTFGYRSSSLPEWVEEKTGGRVPAAEVLRITLDDLRGGGPTRVTALLASLRDGRVAVADAECDDDLRVLALAAARAERAGTRLLYRVGPSFVRARAGQQSRPPLTSGELRSSRAELAESAGGVAPHGLIVVGSHVSVTTRQLDRLREAGGISEFELSVPLLLDPDLSGAHLTDVIDAAVRALDSADVVLRTSRVLVTGEDAQDSLAISRRVSAALAEAVRRITGARRPAFVVAKGGITSSDTATHGLGIGRAWARGTLLPGIVSLWEPVDGPAAGIPYVVFAGNVGDDDALTDVTALLRAS
ncbi:four-carbon acid sugar kinase family protein [Streptomyces sp. NPDC087425]|uniref:four-carbon acid sugar kinase family protein n=1 Tax=Streptomyces sp. NPDC087425 TaxID=3365787 RepID=UPI00380DC658